jgi:uracil-DNA glycosylase
MSNIPNKLTPQEYASKMYEMLKPSGWHNVLKGFLLSEDFVHIIKVLESCVEDGQRFTPPLKQVFRAFMECPYDTTNVIMVGQDPYPQLGVADGIAFSCGNTKKPEASLRYIFKNVNKTVYNDQKDVTTFDPDLARWSKQGVLMLNTSLTTEINKIGKHIPVWDPFNKYLIDMLNANDKEYVWVLMGKQAQQNEDLIDNILNNSQILKCSHPASAAYQKASEWDSSNIFNKVNDALKLTNKPKIVW